MVTLRVASYNLRGLQDERAAAAAVVRAIDPDVLLLQEVPRWPGSSYRIAGFARDCGLLWSGRTWWLAGTALMTSLRVTASDAQDRSLPVRGRIGTRDGDPRSSTSAQVRVPGAPPLTAVSVHLSLLADERVDHVRHVLAQLDTDHPEGPFVVGGDLNETLEGAAWSLLGERLSRATPDVPTFPAAAPRSAIDAIFVSTELTLSDRAPLALDPAMVAAASDHLPVWVDIEV